MTEYKTMRVPVEAWEAARKEKRENETWGEFLQRCSNNPPATGDAPDATELAAEMEAQFDYINVADLVSERVLSELQR